MREVGEWSAGCVMEVSAYERERRTVRASE
jgi:hypothetical protein